MRNCAARDAGTKQDDQTIAVYRAMQFQLNVARGEKDQQFYRYLTTLRVAVLLGDILALIGLGWLAKPVRVPWFFLAKLWGRIAQDGRPQAGLLSISAIATSAHGYRKACIGVLPFTTGVQLASPRWRLVC